MTLYETISDAHHREHSGPFERCPDPICAAAEWWAQGRRGRPGGLYYLPLTEPVVRG